jgi:hypothetical protein
METKIARVHLDWGKLLAFSQVKTNRDNGDFRSLKSPTMTMFGTKTCAKALKPAA